VLSLRVFPAHHLFQSGLQHRVCGVVRLLRLSALRHLRLNLHYHAYTWRHVYDNVHLRGEILAGCVVVIVAIILESIVFLFDAVKYSPSNERYQ